MKLPRRPVLTLCLLVFLRPFLVVAAESATTAEGYWEGAIVLPNGELGIAVELSPSGASGWQGTIDIPMQGMRGFKLTPVKVAGDSIELGMPGVPGEPRFTGKLASDGKTISGDFAQGGGVMAFRLERKAKPVRTPEAHPVPDHGVPGDGLVGRWMGALSPMPSVSLRLALEIALDAAGKPGGVLISLDQGSPRLPISGLTEDAGKVAFDVPSVGGRFTGKMNADGSELAGEWTQNAQSTPLVLKRLPSAAQP